MQDPIKVFGHNACPQVPPLKAWLERQGIAYEYINIRKNQQAAAQVRDINQGYESVPTLVFPDDSTLTEPSLSQVEKRLSALNYEVDRPGWVLDNLWTLLVVLGFALAMLRILGVF